RRLCASGRRIRPVPGPQLGDQVLHRCTDRRRAGPDADCDAAARAPGLTVSGPTLATPAGVGSSTSWPRIVHVIAPAPSGGAESVVLNLAAGIRRAGGDATVVALVVSPGAHPFAAQARLAGIPVTELRSGRRRYRAEARALAAILKSGSAELVHTHGQQAD